jgi:two-component system chemotaxis response regulator CheY
VAIIPRVGPAYTPARSPFAAKSLTTCLTHFGNNAMKTVLVIDDSAVVRKLATRMLAEQNFRVVEADNGATAIARCRDEMPDGILLDWNMPVMDGIEFLRTLRALNNGLAPKVLLCTSESEIDRIALAMEAGADEFIMKPFDADILSSKLALVGLA